MSDSGNTKDAAALEVILGAVLALQLAGCDAPKNYADSEHVYRAVDSPDGGSTARLARVASGGAAGSLSYDVYLSKNILDGGSELVFRGYSDCNPEIEWRGNQLLVIRYAGRSCNVLTFHSFWEERDLERAQAETKVPRVEIMLERVSPATPDVWNP
jgi:hypothetical protein